MFRAPMMARMVQTHIRTQHSEQFIFDGVPFLRHANVSNVLRNRKVSSFSWAAEQRLV